MTIETWFHEEVCELDLFLWAKLFSPHQNFLPPVFMCGHGVMGAQHDRKWRGDFENGQTDTHDNRTIQPSMSRTDVNTGQVEESILENWHIWEIAYSIIMRKWKWMSVNGCECKRSVSTVTEFLNPWQYRTSALVCLEITSILKNNDTSWRKRVIFYGIVMFSNFYGLKNFTCWTHSVLLYCCNV